MNSELFRFPLSYFIPEITADLLMVLLNRNGGASKKEIKGDLGKKEIKGDLGKKEIKKDLGKTTRKPYSMAAKLKSASQWITYDNSVLGRPIFLKYPVPQYFEIPLYERKLALKILKIAANLKQLEPLIIAPCFYLFNIDKITSEILAMISKVESSIYTFESIPNLIEEYANQLSALENPHLKNIENYLTNPNDIKIWSQYIDRFSKISRRGSVQPKNESKNPKKSYVAQFRKLTRKVKPIIMTAVDKFQVNSLSFQIEYFEINFQFLENKFHTVIESANQLQEEILNTKSITDAERTIMLDDVTEFYRRFSLSSNQSNHVLMILKNPDKWFNEFINIMEEKKYLFQEQDLKKFLFVLPKNSEFSNKSFKTIKYDIPAAFQDTMIFFQDNGIFIMEFPRNIKKTKKAIYFIDPFDIMQRSEILDPIIQNFQELPTLDNFYNLIKQADDKVIVSNLA